MVIASPPVADTWAGIITVYFVSPILLAVVGGMVAWARRHSSRVGTIEQSLAVLLQEVNPPKSPSLRELLSDIRAKQGEITGDLRVAAQKQEGYETLADERWQQVNPHNRQIPRPHAT